MRILQVTAEVFPLLKTGGLADVLGALPVALQQAGCDVRLLLPGYAPILDGLQDVQPLLHLPGRFGLAEVTLRQGRLPNGLLAIVIDAPAFYSGVTHPYLDTERRDHPLNPLRFALLGWVAAQLAAGSLPDWRPQIVHGHDWHAGLAMAYMADMARWLGYRPAGGVFSVHNLAYLGCYPATIFGDLGLPGAFYGMDGLEFYGAVSFMKAGLYYADRITTVSPSYAREIQSGEQGCGLHGLLQRRRGELTGILNGVDYTVWSPEDDVWLPARYGSANLAGKSQCKAALQADWGLQPDASAPLFVVASRLAEQKGLHLVLAGLPQLLERGGQLAVLGRGEAALERAFQAVSAEYPGRVATRIGYDEASAHRLFAAADVVLLPSVYEPCGLSQLYGLRYGALPLVRHVGGLADTVVDCTLEALDDDTATGFVFQSLDLSSYLAALRRAFSLYRRPADWLVVQQRAMQQRFDWQSAAERYLALYAEAIPPWAVAGRQ
ncbi:glycogen synthase GlgA [Parachitinimonas caeni]|uniref:Glycogen synthase n=1 Tax=Parachitinimonas caeni TaxID=3031301 RepID=A0ABT7DTW5_9NEIS|nr:glycogen synthase GlgA [Parachitinimonas caeni]MDK2123513.1 glycogen synthase GlgA [Parachitinimonas caeni]